TSRSREQSDLYREVCLASRLRGCDREHNLSSIPRYLDILVHLEIRRLLDH
ncbi:hypothetical protein PanWU01x14_148550, partial [Parasponia andersonii]